MKNLTVFFGRHPFTEGFLYGIVVGIVMMLGLAFSPNEVVVEPEYFSSILASLSILFGFWAVLIGIDTRKKENTQTFRTAAGAFTLMNFVLLALSVISIYFAGLGVFAPKPVLAFLIWAFLFNVFSLARYMYIHTEQSSRN